MNIEQIKQQIEELKAAQKFREAAELEKQLPPEARAANPFDATALPPQKPEPLPFETDPAAAKAATDITSRPAAPFDPIGVGAAKEGVKRIGGAIGDALSSAANVASNPYSIGQGKWESAPSPKSPEAPKATEPEKETIAPLTGKDKPTTEGGSGSAYMKVEGYIPYRKVANEVDDLDNIDFTDENRKLDANQLKVEQQAADLKNQVDTLMAAHNVAREGVEKRELAQQLVQAVGLMAAGAYGLKTGLDLSGVKFNSTDWQQKYAQLQQDLNNKLSVAKEKYGVDMDALGKERQRLMEAKDEKRAVYQMAFQKAQQSTNFKQEERNYQDRLKMWNDEMIMRAKKASAEGKDPVEKLARERENDLDKFTTDYLKLVANIPKLKNNDDKVAAANEAKALDARITMMRGYPMVANPKIYDTAGEGFFSSNWEGIAQEVNKQNNNIAALERKNPEAARYKAEMTTRIQEYTRQYMKSWQNGPGLSLEGADAKAREKVLTEFGKLLSNKAKY